MSLLIVYLNSLLFSLNRKPNRIRVRLCWRGNP